MMFLELFKQQNDSALNLNANAFLSKPRFVPFKCLYILLRTAYRALTVMNSIYRTNINIVCCPLWTGVLLNQRKMARTMNASLRCY